MRAVGDERRELKTAVFNSYNNVQVSSSFFAVHNNLCEAKINVSADINLASAHKYSRCNILSCARPAENI